MPTDYGLLNGEQVDWNAYPVDGVISAVLWISIPVILLFVLYVKKFNKLQKVIKVVAICIVLVQLVTLVIVGVSAGGFSSREKYVATDKNEFTMSKNENIVVLLLDTLDSRVFSNYLDSKEGVHDKEMLKDFTYYRNTTAMYAYTDLAIPYILTGNKYQSGVPYEEYIDETYSNAEALKYLYRNGWDINIYTETNIPQKDLEYDVRNIENVKFTVSSHRRLASYIYSIVGYRYLPYLLKRFCWFYPDDVEQMLSIKNSELDFYDWSNYKFDSEMDTISIGENNKTYHFYHLEGTHTPFTMSADFSGSDTETSIEAETQGIMVMVDHYLNLLKEKDIYDNTAIVIMADHGYTGMRQSPALLIKGIDEKKQFKISDTPVSFSDLQDIMIGLAEHKTADEITSSYSQNRIRDYYFYDVTSKDGIKSMLLNHYEIHGDSFDDEAVALVK